MDQTDLGRVSQALHSINKLREGGIDLSWGTLPVILDGEHTGLHLEFDATNSEYAVGVSQ